MASAFVGQKMTHGSEYIHMLLTIEEAAYLVLLTGRVGGNSGNPLRIANDSIYYAASSVAIPSAESHRELCDAAFGKSDTITLAPHAPSTWNPKLQPDGPVLR